MIDWHEAPPSKLYYEYEAGDLYDEESLGRDRTDAVQHKRRMDTAGGEIHKIIEKGTLLIRSADGPWRFADEGGSVASRKEGKSDHL